MAGRRLPDGHRGLWRRHQHPRPPHSVLEATQVRLQLLAHHPPRHGDDFHPLHVFGDLQKKQSKIES